MASKVLVKIPAVNFNSQVGKCNTDLVGASNVGGGGARTSTVENMPSSSHGMGGGGGSGVGSDSALRVAQLEQNIRFLKEQHHLMLTSLHHEVESLRQRNRDLQFQLVFSRGSVALMKSTPSSPEDDSKPQVLLSPKQVNVTPLQVEILERDVVELRTSLSEARTQNTYLQNIVDEQKRKLETAPLQELGVNGSRVAATSVTTEEDDSQNSPDTELTYKLEEAERIIRRLRRENEEQRRELALIKANQSKVQGNGPGGSGGHYRNGNHRPSPQQRDHREYPQQRREQYREQHQDQGHEHRDQHREHQDQRREQHRDQARDQHSDPHDQSRDGSRFPPLMTQSFWHSSNNGHHGRWSNGWDVRRGAHALNQSLPTLPSLGANSGVPNTHTSNSAPFTLLSHSGGGRRGHRGNFRGDRGGAGRAGNNSAQPGNRGHWEQRDHRGRDRDRHRDQGIDE